MRTRPGAEGEGGPCRRPSAQAKRRSQPRPKLGVDARGACSVVSSVGHGAPKGQAGEQRFWGCDRCRPESERGRGREPLTAPGRSCATPSKCSKETSQEPAQWTSWIGKTTGGTRAVFIKCSSGVSPSMRKSNQTFTGSFYYYYYYYY